MKAHVPCSLVVALLAAATGASAQTTRATPAAAEPPAGRTLLMVDDHDILYRSGTHRVLHPAKRHVMNPMIPQDKPWELTIAYNTVHRDPQTGKYRMWYQSLTDISPEAATVCYAESGDGITWTKPMLGLHKHKGKDTNILLEPAKGHYNASVLIDPRDPDPARRYKMAIFRAVEEGDRAVLGPAVAFSPDGINWKIHPKVPLMKGSWGRRTPPPLVDDASYSWGEPQSMSDVIDVTYDAPRDVFAIYAKTWLDSPEGETFWKRAIVRSESKDFINWSKPQLVMAPDEFDGTGVEYRPPVKKVHQGRRGIQLHGGPVFLYNGMYFSLLQVMDGEITGKMHAELAVSRDGIKWQRHFRDVPFIATDPYKNSFDGGIIWSSNTPVVLEDEIRFYYGAYSGLWYGDIMRPPSGVGLATIQRDRFASVKPIEVIGHVTTKPIDLTGVSAMTVNADARTGPVRVEVLNADGFRMPGFTRDDAVPITGDALRHEVKWNGKSLVDLPAGAYSLRLHLERAELFAVTLKGGTK